MACPKPVCEGPSLEFRAHRSVYHASGTGPTERVEAAIRRSGIYVACLSYEQADIAEGDDAERTCTFIWDLDPARQWDHFDGDRDHEINSPDRPFARLGSSVLSDVLNGKSKPPAEILFKREDVDGAPFNAAAWAVFGVDSKHRPPASRNQRHWTPPDNAYPEVSKIVSTVGLRFFPVEHHRNILRISAPADSSWCFNIYRVHKGTRS